MTPKTVGGKKLQKEWLKSKLSVREFAEESLTLLQTINTMYCDPPIGSKPGDDPREVERIHESIWKCERMNHG